MQHPNNTTFRIDDLFDEDLMVMWWFVYTLACLELASHKDLAIIDDELTKREAMKIKGFEDCE